MPPPGYPITNLDRSNTSISINGVQCWDFGAHEMIDRFGVTSAATREIWCNWSDRLTFYTTARGGGFFVNGFYQFFASLFYPDLPWMAFHSIETVGVPGPLGTYIDTNNQIAYQYAKMTVKFKSALYPESISSGMLEMDIGTDYVQVNSANALIAFPDGTPQSDSLLIPYGVGTIRYTTHNMGDIPWATITTLMNPMPAINSVIFKPPSALGSIQKASFAVGTVLYTGPRTIVRLAADGSWMQDVVHTMSWKACGWNKQYQSFGAHAGSFQTVTIASGSNAGAALYSNSQDLNIIFNSGAP